jgi:MFS family permease
MRMSEATIMSERAQTGSEPAQREKTPSLGDLVGAGAFIVGLASAWLYAAGWTYAYHYFDRFGIPLLMVDIPKENYLVYGGVVVRQFPIWGLVIGLAGLVVVISWRWLGAQLGRLMVPFGLLAILVVFWLGHQAAVVTAHRQYVLQRETDYSAFPRVQVWPKEDAKPTEGSPLASTDLTRGCYRLLLHNQDRLFLLRPLKGAAAADLPLLILPWDQIVLIRVLPDYSSCE